MVDQSNLDRGAGLCYVGKTTLDLPMSIGLFQCS